MSGVWRACLSIVQQLGAVMWGERGYRDDSNTYAWLSSIALPAGRQVFFHRRLPPPSPPSHPVELSPCSQQASAWDCSTTCTLQLPAAVPSREPPPLSGVFMAAAKIVCVILIPFRLSRISCFTVSLKCFPFVRNNCPNMAIWTSALVPPPTKGRSSPTNSPLFLLLPSSYLPLHGPIYSFPLVRYSCLLSPGILQALLCLKVYSRCIDGERCTPHPPTPLPSVLSLLTDF